MATKVLASSGEKVDAGRVIGRLAMANLPIIPLSQSEYDALTTEEQNNGCIYMIYEDPLIEHATAAEWAENIADLKIVSNDISAKGNKSKYWSTFNQFMTDDATFTFQLQNLPTDITAWNNAPAANKKLQCRIVGLNCKDKADGSGKAGLTFMAKHVLPVGDKLNSTNSTSGGYTNASIRTALNSGSYWGYLPTELQGAIVEVTNQHCIANSTTLGNSNDKLWLPSFYELVGSSSTTGYQTSDGPQFPWFAAQGTSASALTSILADMHYTNSGSNPSATNTSFWTRSIYKSNTSNYVDIATNGSTSYSAPNVSMGIHLCFSL